MNKMNGPWYLLNEAQAKLSLSRSELNYLIIEKQIQPVVYTLPCWFLLFRHHQTGWTGFASCQYRGHLALPYHCIIHLLDGANLILGAESGTLLENNGVLAWQSQYPFKKPLPHAPLTEWMPAERNVFELSKFAVTPYPREGYDLLNVIGHGATAYKATEAGNPTLAAAHVEQLMEPTKLFFNDSSLFSPENLRIPASEINRYQRQQEALLSGEKTPVESLESSKQRENQLHALIERIISKHPDFSAKKVWKVITEDCLRDEPLYDHEDILIIVDANCIEWKSRHGKEQSLTYLSFVSVLSRIKKQVRKTEK
ncbi:MAG: hypothetical protein KBT79_08895 [Thalassolituus oleivorans]|nr:hypothetical protein [Thalassolituus oleivorans]